MFKWWTVRTILFKSLKQMKLLKDERKEKLAQERTRIWVVRCVIQKLKKQFSKKRKTIKER